MRQLNAIPKKLHALIIISLKELGVSGEQTNKGRVVTHMV